MADRSLLARLQERMSVFWTRNARNDVGQRPMYEGTADPRAVARRRARNKAARRSRRVNRLRSR